MELDLQLLLGAALELNPASGSFLHFIVPNLFNIIFIRTSRSSDIFQAVSRQDNK
jgi:hypothetical protein